MTITTSTLSYSKVKRQIPTSITLKDRYENLERYFCFRLASDENIELVYFQDNDFEILLTSGAIVSGSGFMIVDRNLQQGTAFFQTSTVYSQISMEEKQTVVEAYNQSLEGEIVETEEDVEAVEPEPEEDFSQNSRREVINGKTLTLRFDKTRRQYRVQVDRQYNYYAVNLEDGIANYEAKKAELEGETPINSEQVIREEQETLKYEGASVSATYHLKIIEVTSGTVANPIITYRVERYVGAFVDSSRDWEVMATSQTQQEAEQIFDDEIQRVTDEYAALAAQDIEDIAAKTPTKEEFTEFDIRWVEVTGYTLQQMMEEGTENALTNEAGQKTGSDIGMQGGNAIAWYSSVGYGPYDDATTFSRDGNTIYMDDFDAPRITTEGVMPNPSGAMKLKVNQNYRMTFELSTESRTFTRGSTPDAVSKSGDTFNFTCYAGDIIEIDIDNERSSLYPFMVTVQGVEWYSAEEIDDETQLTLLKVEYLEVTKTVTEKQVLPDGTFYDDFMAASGVEQDTDFVKTNLTGGAWMYDVENPPTYSKPRFPDSESELMSNPEWMEARYYWARKLETERPAAEDGYISPSEAYDATIGKGVETAKDAGGAVLDTAGDVVSGIWDAIKWPLIIAGVVVVGLVAFAIYMNSNRGGAVAAPPPTVVVTK